MGKRWDAKKVAAFIDDLGNDIDDYRKKAGFLEGEFGRYYSNDTYRGDGAQASKEFISAKQMDRLHEPNRKLQNRFYDECCKIEEDFKKKVDPSSEARIDTDEVREIDRHFDVSRHGITDLGRKVEELTEEVKNRFYRYGEFDPVCINDIRVSYARLCGEGGHLEETIKKFENFDKSMHEALVKSRLKENFIELRDEIVRTASVLDSAEPFRPQTQKVVVKSIVQGTQKAIKAGFVLPNENVQQNVVRDVDKQKAMSKFFQFCDDVEKRINDNDIVKSGKNARDKLEKKQDNLIIGSFDAFESLDNPNVKKIINSDFYKGFKNIVKENVIDEDFYKDPHKQGLKVGAKTFSLAGEELNGVLKAGAKEIIEAQPDNIAYKGFSTAGLYYFFMAGGAVQSYRKTGGLGETEKYASKCFKKFRTMGTNGLIDGITGVFSLPELVVNGSERVEKAIGDAADYIKENGIPDITLDSIKPIDKYSKQAEANKEITDFIGKKIGTMEIDDYYGVAGYLSGFMGSMLLGGEISDVGKAGNAAESATTVSQLGDDAARVAANYSDDAARVVAESSDDVAEIAEAEKVISKSTGNSADGLLPGEGEIGTYKDLLDAGEIGDNITPHHMPSAEYMSQYNVPKKDGLCMNMEMPSPGVGGRHRLTDTYGRNMTNAMKEYYYSLTPRDALAYDISNVRKIYQNQGLYEEIRPQLQQFIKECEELMPELFGK